MGQKMQGQQLAEMKNQMEEFRKHLEEFALKHKKEINDNPVFRKEFLSMCKEIGVDPLSCKYYHFYHHFKHLLCLYSNVKERIFHVRPLWESG